MEFSLPYLRTAYAEQSKHKSYMNYYLDILVGPKNPDGFRDLYKSIYFTNVRSEDHSQIKIVIALV